MNHLSDYVWSNENSITFANKKRIGIESNHLNNKWFWGFETISFRYVCLTINYICFIDENRFNFHWNKCQLKWNWSEIIRIRTNMIMRISIVNFCSLWSFRESKFLVIQFIMKQIKSVYICIYWAMKWFISKYQRFLNTLFLYQEPCCKWTKLKILKFEFQCL